MALEFGHTGGHLAVEHGQVTEKGNLIVAMDGSCGEDTMHIAVSPEALVGNCLVCGASGSGISWTHMVNGSMGQRLSRSSHLEVQFENGGIQEHSSMRNSAARVFCVLRDLDIHQEAPNFAYI